MENVVLDIVSYSPEYQPWFEKFNRDWIEKYFWMEPVDVAVLQNPEEHIIKQGGAILMAICNKEIAGTVALKYVDPGVYEFTKMAVDEKFRGFKIGQALAEAAIEKAKASGAHKVILYSNTVLVPAISLYRKLGFKETPLDRTYERGNIKMELTLHVSGASQSVGSIVAPTESVVSIPAPGAIKIRSATLDDADNIRELGIKTFSDTFGPHNTAEDMRLYLQKSFGLGQVQREIQESDTIFLLAHEGDQLVGYAKMRASGIPEGLAAPNPIEIERIYVAQEFLGKKVGKQLMEACLSAARQHGHDCVWLGVWEHNAKAIAFYERFGFEKFGAHPFLLGTDLQTDFLMKKKV